MGENEIRINISQVYWPSILFDSTHDHIAVVGILIRRKAQFPPVLFDFSLPTEDVFTTLELCGLLRAAKTFSRKVFWDIEL